MKQDLTMTQLRDKVTVLSKLKKDYLVPTNELTVSTNGDVTFLNVQGTPYALQDRAASQISALTHMPYSYYQRLKAHYPDLLDRNLNRWI